MKQLAFNHYINRQGDVTIARITIRGYEGLGYARYNSDDRLLYEEAKARVKKGHTMQEVADRYVALDSAWLCQAGYTMLEAALIAAGFSVRYDPAYGQKLALLRAVEDAVLQVSKALRQKAGQEVRTLKALREIATNIACQ